jgi:hypothetical protein
MSYGKSNESATRRTRNYATVVYPESAPQDWQTILADHVVPVFISPLHDQDQDPDEQIKKPHYHILLCFENVKTKDQAIDIFDKIGGVGCEVVNSLRGYSRYLCHLDNPDKHQYSPDEVICLGGTDYLSAIGLPTDKYKAIKEMIQYCKENRIVSYSELLDYASENHYDWFRVLCDSATVVLKEYLKSKTWTDTYSSQRNNVNPHTGEIT